MSPRDPCARVRVGAILVMLLLAGCAGAPDACTDAGEPVCFDDGACVDGSGCGLEYRGIRGLAWFSGALDVDRALEGLQLAGHRDARIRDDGTGLVAGNVTVEPLASSVWWYARAFAEPPVGNLSAAKLAERGEARWKLLESGFRNDVLRFHGSYGVDPERVGWSPILTRS